MFGTAGVRRQQSVVDVGAGASTLVDALLSGGFADSTVVDISARGLEHARRRLGTGAGKVQWLITDILTWRPEHRYQVWHDRAVFHFLTTGRARQRYLQALHAATTMDAIAVDRRALRGPSPEFPPRRSLRPLRPDRR